MNKKPRICIGLSGGVDSSVAALLLARQGCDVFALFMQNWHDTTGTLHGECEWEEDRSVAEMVARKIGIPFHFVDLSDIYRQRVVDYMFGEYEKGRTPNPDVMCNREIKFDAFLKAARALGADFVATGHYCRKESFTDADGRTIYRILAGSDPNKDQSYFLCQLTQEQLSAALFPIGELAKPEVRRIAREAGLPSADKKDSQGICFVGKVDLPVFLQQKIKPKEGDIVEIPRSFYEGRPAAETLEQMAEPLRYRSRDGKVIGKHIGAQYYTIGQRKGLNIGGQPEPLFVIAIDVKKNQVVLGPRSLLQCSEVSGSQLNLMVSKDSPLLQQKLQAKIRLGHTFAEASITELTDNRISIRFDTPQFAATPGQIMVLYAGDGIVASAIIEK